MRKYPSPEFVSARPQVDRIDPRRRKEIDWQYWPSTRDLHLDSTNKTLELDLLDRPDIEDDTLIEWGLARSENATGRDVNIDVLHGNGVNLSRSQIF